MGGADERVSSVGHGEQMVFVIILGIVYGHVPLKPEAGEKRRREFIVEGFRNRFDIEHEKA